MQWIKEVELVDSVDELRSSSSTRGISMPNFEVLDARIASALNRIIHNSQFKRRISLEEQKAQKEDRFLRGRQIVHLIYEHFWVTGANDSVENYADLFTISLRNDDIQEFDSKWDGFLLSLTKIPPDDILEGLYKSRIRESGVGHNNTRQHNNNNTTTTPENFAKTLKHQNWPKSVWPKLVKTTIGQSRSKKWPKSVWPKSAMTTPSHHRWSTRGREDQCCRVPHSRFGACLLFQLEWRCDALTTPGAVAHVLHRLRSRRATFRDETLPLVDTADEVREQGPPGEFDRTRIWHRQPFTWVGNVWVICDPEDPDFGKSMDLRGQSFSLGDYGLAGRAEGEFVAVKRRPLITVPSLLSDSINLQRKKGTDDVSGKEGHTDAPLKGLRESPVEDPTVGEQACESAEHEDVRTFWVSLGSGGRMEALGPQQFLKEFDIGSKERTAMELKTLVRCLLLSGGHDHLNAANLYCLEEVARRACQLVEAYESGAHGKPNWNSVKWFTSVHSNSTMVPVSIRSFAFTKAKEQFEAENLRLRATKTVLVFDDGDRETPAAPQASVAMTKQEGKGKEKKRKGRGS